MAETALIGTTLAGRFRISGVIGEGGMATVYRGVQEGEPKQVAIKIMNPELAKETRFVRRFRREAKAAAMLKHPNMVSILEFGVDQGLVYLAMELLEGFDLAMLLHREQQIPELRAIQIAVQVCRALSAAHEQNIVHRDLKPDNIMLVRLPPGVALPIPGMNPADFVKVLDFGIAKILDADEGTTVDPRADPASSQFTSERTALTRVGTIVGTPAYMAPEQGRAEQVDARTDLYAVGVLLYELLTGRVPFTGETPMQVVMRHVNEPPRPPSDFIKLRPELEKVIMRALAKWPAQRQQSAEEMAFELLALLPFYAPPAPPPAPKLALDPSKTLVMEVEEPGQRASGQRASEQRASEQRAPEQRAVPAPMPSPRGAAAPAPIEPPAFPTLNIEVPDDLFPTAPAAAPKAPPARPAAAPAAPKPAAGAAPAPPSRERHPHQATLTSPVDPTSRAAPPPKRAAPEAAVEVARAAPIGGQAASLAQTLNSAGLDPNALGPDDDDDDVPTRMKSPEEAQAALQAQAPKPGVSGPASSKAARTEPSPKQVPASPEAPARPASPPPSPADARPKAAVAPAAGANKGGLDATLALDDLPPPPPMPAPAVAEQPAPTAAARTASSNPPREGGDGPVRRPTSELIPITLSTDDDPSAPRASLPQVEVAVLPSEAPAPVAVWQPKQRRMSGTTALVAGILIGALLFGAILVAVLAFKP